MKTNHNEANKIRNGENLMTSKGLEPLTFGTGIRRATNCANPSSCWAWILKCVQNARFDLQSSYILLGPEDIP